MKTIPAEALRAPNTLECHNLRPSSSGAALEAVGTPATAAPAGHTPLLHFSAPDGMHLLTHQALTLYVNGTNKVAKLRAAPLCAAFDGSSTLHIMTAAGPQSFGWPRFNALESGDASLYPAVSLQATATSPLRAEVAARTLSDNYRRLSALTSADARAVRADLMAAQASIAAEAVAQRVMIQPALARYRLLDAEGRTLFTSPPVLLGTSQCHEPLRLDCSTDALLEGYSLSAEAWQLRVHVPAGTSSQVRYVRVSVSPQFQPADIDAQPDTFVTHSTSSSATIGVSMHLNPTALLPSNADASALTVAEAMARMDALERTVATIAATPGTDTVVACAPAGTPAQETTALRAVLARELTPSTTAESRIAAPHGFTARCVACAADTMLWGNISARRYCGYPAPVLAAAFSAKAQAWRAYVSVDFADGSRTVWTGSDDSAAPEMFGPVLSYPSGDAVAMSIGISHGADTAAQTFALTPLPGGAGAAYVHPSLAPFALAAAAEFAVPDAIESAAEYPGTVVAADTATPFVPLAVRDACGGAVVALLPASGSTASWDFGRTRFTAFGHGGICSVALDSARRSLATGRMDSRRVACAKAVAQAGDTVYAIAGGDLLRISGRTVGTTLRACGADALAWDGAHAELWCMRPDGTAEILCTASKPLRSYTRTISPTAILSSPAGAFAATEGGVLALHSEQRGATDVRWRARIEHAAGAMRPLRRLTLHAAGSGLRLDVALYAAGMLGAEPMPTVRLAVAGRLGEAGSIAVPMRYVRRFDILVAGTAGADFTLSRIDLP